MEEDEEDRDEEEDGGWALLWEYLAHDESLLLAGAIEDNVNLQMRPARKLPGLLRNGPLIILAAAFWGALNCVRWLVANSAGSNPWQSMRLAVLLPCASSW